MEDHPNQSIYTIFKLSIQSLRPLKMTYNTLEANPKKVKTKKHLISVNPKSSKAKNRFANVMDSLHAMEVEQETDTQFFVVSINKRYCFWLNKENDPHWNIIK